MSQSNPTPDHRWKYDPGEWRFKHKWGNDYAGFEIENHEEVGKCPTSIDIKLAEELLNTGIGDPNMESPKNIFNVHQGVVYRAKVTLLGVSFHGFPEKETENKRVPIIILRALARRSQADGTFHLFKGWVQKYLPKGWSSIPINIRCG
ncbi:MAG: hypothetical protein HQL93_00555 [Magnetococcales bacterium]|nr:hypothetical protein [Magnetococcales bacterium]